MMCPQTMPVERSWVVSRTRKRLYYGREAMTGGTAAHNTAAHAVDNPQRGLVSYDRRNRWWWRVSCSLFSEALSASCAPQICLERS